MDDSCERLRKQGETSEKHSPIPLICAVTTALLTELMVITGIWPLAGPIVFCALACIVGAIREGKDNGR